jgi:hypothetical protein
MPHHPDTIRPRAFTLVEMTLSIAMASLVFAGLTSAMLVAARGAGTGALNAVDAQRALEIISADIAAATACSGISATSLTLVVPDRTGDGVAETIGYSWSGVAGAPVLRTVNGASANLISGAKAFSLSADTLIQTLPTTYDTSNEILLASYTTPPLLGGVISITTSGWVGEYIQPSFPSNAVTWSVTRARVKVRAGGSSSDSARIELCNTSGGFPTTVIDYSIIKETDLPGSLAWRDFAFSNVTGRVPGSAVCLVLQSNSGSNACDVLTQSLSLAIFNTNMVRSNNGGSSWYAPLTQDMLFELYGTYTTAQPAKTQTVLSAVHLSLQPSSDATTLVRSAALALNQPVVSP